MDEQHGAGQTHEDHTKPLKEFRPIPVPVTVLECHPRFDSSTATALVEVGAWSHKPSISLHQVSQLAF